MPRPHSSRTSWSTRVVIAVLRAADAFAKTRSSILSLSTSRSSSGTYSMFEAVRAGIVWLKPSPRMMVSAASIAMRSIARVTRWRSMAITSLVTPDTPTSASVCLPAA